MKIPFSDPADPAPFPIERAGKTRRERVGIVWIGADCHPRPPHGNWESVGIAMLCVGGRLFETPVGCVGTKWMCFVG